MSIERVFFPRATIESNGIVQFDGTASSNESKAWTWTISCCVCNASNNALHSHTLNWHRAIKSTIIASRFLRFILLPALVVWVEIPMTWFLHELNHISRLHPELRFRSATSQLMNSTDRPSVFSGIWIIIYNEFWILHSIGRAMTKTIES